MLYRFKTKNMADVVMLEPNGRQVLEIIGKGVGPKGIILVEQMPAALQALRDAIARDEAQERLRQQALAAERQLKEPEGVHVPLPPGVSLRHRALPFMQMLEACQRLGDNVVWGV